MKIFFKEELSKGEMNEAALERMAAQKKEEFSVIWNMPSEYDSLAQDDKIEYDKLYEEIKEFLDNRKGGDGREALNTWKCKKRIEDEYKIKIKLNLPLLIRQEPLNLTNTGVCPSEWVTR